MYVLFFIPFYTIERHLRRTIHGLFRIFEVDASRCGPLKKFINEIIKSE